MSEAIESMAARQSRGARLSPTSRLPARTLLLVLLVGALPVAVTAQSTDRLYQQACDDGDWIACNVFGLMLETGEIVPRDLVRAGELYRLVCERGIPVACMNLGRLYQAGAGVPADSARAAGLFLVACEGGDLVACDLGDLLRADGAAPAQRYFLPGRVRDGDSGALLPEAIVEVPELGARSISDASGRLAMGGLPAGRYRLRAQRAGYDAFEGEIAVPGESEFLVLLTRSEGIDVNAPGQIVGQVVEGIDQGLANVEVSVVGQERARTLSNQQGRFTLRNVAPGLAEIRFVRLGYVPRMATLIVQPETTVEVGASMAVEPIVFEAIEVSVRSRNLEQSGFYQRAEAGWGTHFRPSDLAELQPVLLSDALRGRVPGVRVEQDVFRVGGTARLVSRRSSSISGGGGDCPLEVFIDGVPAGVQDIDLYPPEMVEAVEVYQGVETPIQYSYLNQCGAALIWTRRAN